MKAAGVSERVATVLGSGRQGTCAAYDLALHGGAAQIRLADQSEAALQLARDRMHRLVPEVEVTTVVVNAEDESSLAGAMAGAATCVCALPYRFAPAASRAAIHARCSLVDLGGNTSISKRVLDLDREAASAGVCLVPDTGLAPGLANTLAASGVARLESPRAVRIWCGGLPTVRLPPLDYKLVFSIEGLFNEYSGDAVYLRNGVLVRVPALSEIETTELPGIGEIEAFPTSGGTSTAPQSYLGQLETYEYRTVRYRGHRDRFRSLADLGLLSEEPIDIGTGTTVRPRDLLTRLLTPLLDHPGITDLVVLRVEITGEKEHRSEQIIFDLLDREDEATGFSAMERCTAHPAAVVAEMAAAGEISPGARRLEEGVPPDKFLTRLARRPLPLTETSGPPPVSDEPHEENR